MINALAGAYVERSPLVVVNGGPTVDDQACPRPTRPLSLVNPADGTEKQLATTIVGLIRAAAAPLILIGTEIQRYGLADQVADLITKLGVRWSTALLAKSTLAEQGNGWVGVYDPPHSIPAVARAVERADLLVMLGCVFPNGYKALVTRPGGHIVSAYDGKVEIKSGAKQHVEIGALVTALVTEAQRRRRNRYPPVWCRPRPPRLLGVS